jgi:adenylate cyclase class 2
MGESRHSPYLAWTIPKPVLEVEAKVELLLPGALRDRLRAAGATPSPLENHHDVFFSHPDRDFARTDEALRWRRVDEQHQLTYKGPKRGAGVKVRDEHELTVDGDPTALLEGLGFRTTLALRKQRESWDLDGTNICIDSIDGLGTFAEVEVVGNDEVEATARVEAVLKGLGLAGAARFSQSYLEMAISLGIATDF